MLAEFGPERIRETPISELAIVGSRWRGNGRNETNC